MCNFAVAPLAGAWIEINGHHAFTLTVTVAPLAGAWIEIAGSDASFSGGASRSPRGSVD